MRGPLHPEKLNIGCVVSAVFGKIKHRIRGAIFGKNCKNIQKKARRAMRVCVLLKITGRAACLFQEPAEGSAGIYFAGSQIMTMLPRL